MGCDVCCGVAVFSTGLCFFWAWHSQPVRERGDRSTQVPYQSKKSGNIWHPPIEAIDEKSVKLMQHVYGEPTMNLGDQRYNAYREQIMKGTLRPERLPQLSGGAVQHGRRMFTQ